MISSKLGRGSIWKWAAAFATTMLFIMFAVYGVASISAPESTPTPATSASGGSGGVPASPGDCWAGALSREQIHCYFLEAAQRAGKIEVAAVYLASGGGPLYIFLRQTEAISDEVADFLEAKAHEYIETEYDAGRSGLPLGQCKGYSGDERKACFNNALGNPSWRDFDPRQSDALPRSKTYEDILLRVGGLDGRRTVPGWASWSQVWPQVASGAGGASGGHDVSDVDTTNIPDPDCDKEYPVSGIVSMSQSCHAWKNNRTLGIAALYTPGNFGPPYPNAVYVQLKVSDLDNNEELQAIVSRLPQAYSSVPGWELVAIPVKYDFGELWRWSVILDRFAVSAGNTIGITGGDVTFNHQLYGSPNNRPIVWLNDAEPARGDEYGSGWDWSTLRNILMVWAVDEERAAAALPQVLSALGIPANAVGLVAHDDKTPLNVQLAIGSTEGSISNAPIQGVVDSGKAVAGAIDAQPSDALAAQANDRRRLSTWTIVGGALVIGTVVLGAAVGVSFRLRRRRLA